MTECSGNVLLKEECENHEKCMKMIQAVLDGSASPEEIEHFKSNMEVCKPCFDGYELEKSIKNCLQTKVEKKNCPQNTVDQLKAKIGIGLVLLANLIIKIKVIQAIFLS
jgi:anti-sigma factor (TIGR02949 family)